MKRQTKTQKTQIDTCNDTQQDKQKYILDGTITRTMIRVMTQSNTHKDTDNIPPQTAHIMIQKQSNIIKNSD